jgi:hypothetical protein
MEEVEYIRLTGCTIAPNDCPMDEPLSVHLEFDALAPLPATFWDITFIADHMNKRKIVLLGHTEESHMQEGPNEMTFAIDAIDVSALSKHVLTNVGLLSLRLMQAAENPNDPPTELVQVGMVTFVTEADGQMIRNITTPLG